MAQQVIVLAFKPDHLTDCLSDDLSSFLGTHMVEGEN